MHGDQIGPLTGILGGRCKEKLVSCAVWTSRAQTIHSEDALEVSERHFDLLALAARNQKGVSRGDIVSKITGALVDRAEHLARYLGRTTARHDGARDTFGRADAETCFVRRERSAVSSDKREPERNLCAVLICVYDG